MRGERSQRPQNLVSEKESVVKSPKKSIADSDTNQRKIRNAHEVLDRITQRATVKGFHGVIELKIKVMDGTIMQIYETSEQMHKD